MVLTRTFKKACTGQFLTIFVFGVFGFFGYVWVFTNYPPDLCVLGNRFCFFSLVVFVPNLLVIFCEPM